MGESTPMSPLGDIPYGGIPDGFCSPGSFSPPDNSFEVSVSNLSVFMAVAPSVSELLGRFRAFISPPGLGASAGGFTAREVCLISCCDGRGEGEKEVLSGFYRAKRGESREGCLY